MHLSRLCAGTYELVPTRPRKPVLMVLEYVYRASQVERFRLLTLLPPIMRARLPFVTSWWLGCH